MKLTYSKRESGYAVRSYNTKAKPSKADLLKRIEQNISRTRPQKP